MMGQVEITLDVPVAAVSTAWLVSAVAFALSMAGTPGPNNAMLASSGSLWGFRRTVPHMLGVSIGFPVMLVLVAGGGGRLLTSHPAALSVLRWLGVTYLLYLAWRIATAEPQTAGAATPTRPNGRPLGFLQAVLFQWVNPKAWLVTLSALATLSSAHRPSLGLALALAAVFLAVTLPVTAFWTWVGVGVSRVFGTRRALRRFNLAMAALLVASVALAIAGVY